MSYTANLENLKNKGLNEVIEIIKNKGVESKHSKVKCLKINDDDLMFNLEGDRYLTEITSTLLVDNSGYTYKHEALKTDDLMDVIDHIIKTYK